MLANRRAVRPGICKIPIRAKIPSIRRLPDLAAGQFEFALKGHGFTGSGKTQVVSGHRFSCDSQDLTLHTALSDWGRYSQAVAGFLSAIAEGRTNGAKSCKRLLTAVGMRVECYLLWIQMYLSRLTRWPHWGGAEEVVL